MGTFSTGRKVASFGSLILGLVLTIAGLGLSITGAGDLILGYMPINGTNTPIILGRGAMFVCGIILFFVGLYLFPTLKHHRAIVNIIFLFPLLFAFAVTVIIPLILWHSVSDIPLQTGTESSLQDLLVQPTMQECSSSHLSFGQYFLHSCSLYLT